MALSPMSASSTQSPMSASSTQSLMSASSTQSITLVTSPKSLLSMRGNPRLSPGEKQQQRSPISAGTGGRSPGEQQQQQQQRSPISAGAGGRSLRRKASKRMPAPARPRYDEEEEEGYGSGEFEDGQIALLRIRIKVCTLSGISQAPHDKPRVISSTTMGTSAGWPSRRTYRLRSSWIE